MRIQFKTDGGFAYLPGLSQPTTINSEDLPLAEATHLQKLVQAVEGKNQKQAVVQGAADYQRYTIQIDTGEGSYTVQVTDPVADPSLQALVAYLRDKSRELLRAKGRK
ncbi:MAG: protealysin inhibitor emfourin [bacterium]